MPKTTDVLKQSGHAAFYVGGCVRDMLLGRKPKDYDVATDATPTRVLAIMEQAGLKTIATGLQHGTVTVLDPEMGPMEVTTFRADGDYTDARRPDSVRFALDLHSDLSRRDFTVNSLAADPDTVNVIDMFDGQADLEARLIRCVGNANDRFNEDPLRMFRACRFVAKGFVLHASTLAGIQATVRDHLDRVLMLSAERKRDEIMKAMTGDYPDEFWSTALQANLLPFLVPEMVATVGMTQPSQYHRYYVWEHSVLTLRHMRDLTQDPLLRFVAFVHDVGKVSTRTVSDNGVIHFLQHEAVGAEMLKTIMERLKFSNDQVARAVNLVRHHLVPYTRQMSDGAVRRLVAKVGAENLDDLLMLRRADLLAHGTDQTEKLADLEHLRNRVQGLAQSATLAPRLAVNGHDLLALGLSGKRLGDVLKSLHALVQDDPSKNDRETLLSRAVEAT